MTSTFSYEYNLIQKGRNVLFSFTNFPEIETSLPRTVLREMPAKAIQEFSADLVLGALQKRISEKERIPKGSDPFAASSNGLVVLTVVQAMKLVFIETCSFRYDSIADLARRLKTSRSSARQLLDLRHRSKPEQIEAAMAVFGHNFVPTLSVRSKIIPDTSKVLKSTPVI